METNQYGLKRSKKDNDILMKYVLIAVSSLTVLIISLIIIFTLVNSGTAIANINLWDFFFGESRSTASDPRNTAGHPWGDDLRRPHRSRSCNLHLGDRTVEIP